MNRQVNIRITNLAAAPYVDVRFPLSQDWSNTCFTIMVNGCSRLRGLVLIYSISLSVSSTVMLLLMIMNVTIGWPVISVTVIWLSWLNSSKGLAIIANLNTGLSISTTQNNVLSPWVDVVLDKQDSTACMYGAGLYCRVMQAPSWS